MFKTLRWVVAGLALQLMVGQASAQFGGRGGAGGTSSVTLAQQKSVQDELKLSEEQIEKLKQVGAKMREAFGGGGGGGDREEARKKFAEATQAAEKDMAGILSADQTKRLKEITLQQIGPMAFARPEVAKEVGLSDDQQAKVKEITDAYSSETRAQFQAGGGGGDREEARKKRETLRKDTGDKLLALLKDDQKKAWEKLVGEPFKGEIQPFGGNRPRNKNAQ
jgi:hypothetical protein